MADITFPTFSEEEILTHEKLNAFVQSLQDKFTSGITSVDLEWPLVAEGDIIMGSGAAGYSIQGGKEIFKVTNAAGYDTFQAAVTAAGAGGAVFIPPSTTITTQGVILPDRFALFGAGPSSILRVESGAGYLLATSASGTTGLLVANLRLDGNSVAGQRGIVMRGVTGARVDNVWFTGFVGNAVDIITDSVGTNQDIHIHKCRFSGGDAHHVNIQDASNVYIRDCNFGSTSDGSAVRMVPSVGAVGRGIRIAGCATFGTVGYPVFDLVGRTSLSSSYGNIHVTECAINAASVGTNYGARLGSAADPLQDVTFSRNILTECDDSGGIVAAGEYIHVVSNIVRGSGTAGVDLADLASGVASGNTIQGFTSSVVYGTDGYTHGNQGEPYGYANFNSFTVVGAASNDGLLVTVPANRLRVGSRLRFRANFAAAGSNTNSQCTLRQGPLGSGNAIGVCYSRGDGVASSMDVSMVVTASTTAIAHCLGWQAVGDSATGAQAFTVAIDRTAAMPFHINVAAQAGVTVTAGGLVATIEEEVEIV